MLSLQSQFVYLLLGNKGTMLDAGCGNFSGEPCSSNCAWLYELGWRGIGFEYDELLANQAKTMFAPEMIIVKGDCLQANWEMLFDHFNMPKIFDYVTIDIDNNSLLALKKFVDTGHKTKILHVEHDRYNPQGEERKTALRLFMSNQEAYRLVVEDVGLSFCTKNYLEDWFILKEADFLIPEIHNMFWNKVNPNQVIFDLCKIKKW